MNTYKTFGNLHDAMQYRHDNGTGGWIFNPDTESGNNPIGCEVILFPPEFTPSAIFHHNLTRGLSGRIIGSQ